MRHWLVIQRPYFTFNDLESVCQEKFKKKAEPFGTALHAVSIIRSLFCNFSSEKGKSGDSCRKKKQGRRYWNGAGSELKKSCEVCIAVHGQPLPIKAHKILTQHEPRIIPPFHIRVNINAKQNIPRFKIQVTEHQAVKIEISKLIRFQKINDYTVFLHIHIIDPKMLSLHLNAWGYHYVLAVAAIRIDGTERREMMLYIHRIIDQGSLCETGET